MITVMDLAETIDFFTKYRIELIHGDTGKSETVCIPRYPDEIPEMYRDVVVDSLRIENNTLVIEICI